MSACSQLPAWWLSFTWVVGIFHSFMNNWRALE